MSDMTTKDREQFITRTPEEEAPLAGSLSEVASAVARYDVVPTDDDDKYLKAAIKAFKSEDFESTARYLHEVGEIDDSFLKDLGVTKSGEVTDQAIANAGVVAASRATAAKENATSEQKGVLGEIGNFFLKATERALSTPEESKPQRGTKKPLRLTRREAIVGIALLAACGRGVGPTISPETPPVVTEVSPVAEPLPDGTPLESPTPETTPTPNSDYIEGSGYPTTDANFLTPVEVNGEGLPEILAPGTAYIGYGPDNPVREKLVELGAEADVAAIEAMLDAEIKRDPLIFARYRPGLVYGISSVGSWTVTVRDKVSGDFFSIRLTEGPDAGTLERSGSLIPYFAAYGPEDDFFDLEKISMPYDQRLTADRSGWWVVEGTDENGERAGFWSMDAESLVYGESAVAREFTGEQVADFTPETVPDKFIHFNHEWVKTTVEENGEQIEVWKAQGDEEWMENTDMRFVTLYEHYIKDMFVEQTTLGRFHLLVTPEAPFRLRFPNDPQIGETIITKYLIPEMGEKEAKAAVIAGAEVYSVYGQEEKTSALPDGSRNYHTPIYNEGGTERIGELISLRTSNALFAGPFVMNDGRVIFGQYWTLNNLEAVVELRTSPDSEQGKLRTPYMEIARAIVGAGHFYETFSDYEFNLDPLAAYLEGITIVVWFDGWVPGNPTPTP